ncbi:hypothetical protein OIU85_013949 [Salix viminalis]|uniref:Rapid ALkalinization Factor n=1 Tax=Salix viminalis TaxID=40686 RepID=A0A9Q0NMP9_SALVM|nr:hypothetical protein OIU85_013949 [Salix viminalis]
MISSWLMCLALIICVVLTSHVEAIRYINPGDLDKCNVPGHRPEDCRPPPRPPLNTPRRPCLKKDRCRGGDKQSLVSEQRGNENLPFLGSSYSPNESPN